MNGNVHSFIDVACGNIISPIEKIVIYFQNGSNMIVSTSEGTTTTLSDAQIQAVGTRDTLVSVLLEKYIDLFKKPNVAPDYMASLIGWNRMYVLPMIGEMKCGEITTSKAQELLVAIPKNYTRKRVKSYLKSFFAWLVGEGVLTRNPIYSVKLRPIVAVKRRAFEFEEQKRMLEILPTKYRGVFFFLCCSSMRLSEFCAFRSEKAYDRKLHIFEAYNAKSGKVGKCKTRSSVRTVPYLDELMITAKELSGDTDIFSEDINYYGIKKALSKAINKLNIQKNQNGKLSTHSTRHTFSSMCYHLGVRDKQIQVWMGHSTVGMTVDTYTHLIHSGSSPILAYFKKMIQQFSKETTPFN